ncbi:MAG: YcgL domain-containing protein [Pseudomonadota bacterium]|nr:YcgL domain-containing protein [Pseudomonadota bacterium]
MSEQTDGTPPSIECPVIVFRSGRKAETYLYMPATAEFEDLPASLRQQFGTPTYVMDLILTPRRKLAQVDVLQVIQAVNEVGFFLQLPPPTVKTAPKLPEQFLR